MSEDPSNRATSGCDVFVSYASQDVAIANSVVESLEKNGIRCWIAPRDVTPGSQYADEIVGAINDAKVFVLVLSEHAVTSAHVGREIERAASKRRRVIALKIDAAPLTRSFEYFLSESQWIDVAPLGMPGALAKLAQAVGQASTTSASPAGGIADSASSRVKRSFGMTKGLAVAGLVVIMTIGLAVGIHLLRSKQGNAQAPVVAAISDKSIAVLPFADMSQKKDQEYFGDGMAEEILDLLAKIPGLTVIGRTSSFQFKGKNEDLRKIGTELNAAYVLEGSVRNSGDQVRITAQLINTRSGAHEWSETYDRPIGDVLKLQDAIAAVVVRELQLTVDSEFLNRSTLKSTEAYDLLLRGRHAADRFDKEGLEEAERLFKQALDRDPTFVDATAALAYDYFNLGAYGFLAPQVAYERSRRAAADALKLDPQNALAHWTLGGIHQSYDWNWAAADQEFRQAATSAPGSWEALNGKAWLSLILGRWDEALSQIRAALVQDPLNPDSYEGLAWIQMGRGHLSEAEAAIRRALAVRPNYAWGHFMLGVVLLEQGNPNAALLEMQQEQQEVAQLSGQAMVYHAFGRTAEADAALARLLKDQAADNPFQIAAVYAFRRQPDEAMRWLEHAYTQKDFSLYLIKAWLPLESIKTDPRFKAFLKKMNLPE
jgi:TolB-like protein/tetratricopeptide (TPR) repeat protein